MGKAGDWKNTIAGAVLGGKIYTVESGGVLYETDPSSGSWRAVGSPEFAKTRFFFSANGSLYSIETDGKLYQINPSTGSWSEVG